METDRVFDFCRRTPYDYFGILITGFRGEALQSFCYRDKPRPMAAIFLTDQISSSFLFCRGSPSDHLFQIIFNSDHWFQRRFC